MDELIAKLEAAAGSRELDAELHWLCLQPRYAAISPELEAEAYVRHAKLDYELAGTVIPHDEYIKHPTAPAYTTSLDAAVTLVPDGWAWLARNHDGGLQKLSLEDEGNGKFGFGSVSSWGADGPIHHAFAATAPVALCIAALKARAQSA